MVVFTCNHCGESLQKPRVEKHYQTVCRKNPSLTCVDCLKDFMGEEFAVHTKCVTEQERYAAKGSLPNGVVKKGEAKQETWTEMIQNIISSTADLAHPIRNLLNIIGSYTNIPRKKIRFTNFVRNINGGRINIADIDACWDLIESTSKAKSSPNTTPSKDSKRKAEENGEATSKKLKLEEETNGVENQSKSSKKRKQTDETLEENGEEVISKKKKKKDKSKQLIEEKSDVTENAEELSGAKVEGNDSTSGGKKKKKSKKMNGEKVPQVGEENAENGTKEILPETECNGKMEEVPKSNKKKNKSKEATEKTLEVAEEVEKKTIIETERDEKKEEPIENGEVLKSDKKKKQKKSKKIITEILKVVENGSEAIPEIENIEKKEEEPTGNGEVPKSDKKKQKKSKEATKEIVENGNKEIVPETELNGKNEEEQIGNVGKQKTDKKKKQKKSKETAEAAPEAEETVKDEESEKKAENGNACFQWEEKVMEILNGKSEIPLKKLEKKITAEYKKSMGVTEISAKTLKKFNKKLKKMNAVLINNDTVQLKQ